MMIIKSQLIVRLLLQIIAYARLGSAQFFLPDHPYIAPRLNDQGVAFQRSPCPGLNTLANHGYIRRDGTNMSFVELAKKLEEVFGTSKDTIVMPFVQVMLDRGGPSTVTSETGKLLFDLFDLHTEFPFVSAGSLFRQKNEPFAPFNETIFQKLAERADDDGLLTFADVVQQKTANIATRLEYDFLPFENDLQFAVSLALVQTMVVGLHHNLDVVPVDHLMAFFKDNRLHDNFVPQKQRGLAPLSNSNVYGPKAFEASSYVKFAWTKDLDKVVLWDTWQQQDPSEETAENVTQDSLDISWVGIGLGVGAALLVLLLYVLMHHGCTEKKDTETPS